MMTTSQLLRRDTPGSHLRRTLVRSARTLRSLHEEQAYAWERFFRAGLPPHARTPARGPSVHT